MLAQAAMPVVFVPEKIHASGQGGVPDDGKEPKPQGMVSLP